MSSTPQQRVHEATRRLLDLLVTRDSISAEAIELRAELAETPAAPVHLDDAVYHADALFKAVQRAHGPDHAAVDGCRRSAAVIESPARARLADARDHQVKPDSSS